MSEWINTSSGCSSECSSELLSIIKQLKLNNSNRIITDHLNVNSIRNKFVEFNTLVKDYIDIVAITETKLIRQHFYYKPIPY